LQHPEGGEDSGFVLFGDGRVQCGLGGGYCISVEFTAVMKSRQCVGQASSTPRGILQPSVCLKLGECFLKQLKYECLAVWAAIAQSV